MTCFVWLKLITRLLDTNRREIGRLFSMQYILSVASQNAKAHVVQLGANDEFFEHRKGWAFRLNRPPRSVHSLSEYKDYYTKEFIRLYTMWYKKILSLK